jgi:hypothetical protein
LATSRLPLDVKLFLTELIDSVSHLEVLLMLFNSKNKEFTAENVSRELRSNTHSAANQLAQLVAKGLLAVRDEHHFRYCPSTPEIDANVQKLSSLYNEMPVAVVTCIYEKPTDKLKGFSDAFKFKKD